jgi:hypothetical protein
MSGNINWIAKRYPPAFVGYNSDKNRSPVRTENLIREGRLMSDLAAVRSGKPYLLWPPWPSYVCSLYWAWSSLHQSFR